MSGSVSKPSRKSLVEQFLRENAPAEISASVLTALRRYVAGRLEGARVSDRYLVELAENAGFSVARELGGLPADLRDRIHFHDLDAAQSSLLEMAREYAVADRRCRQDCRRAVRRAQDRLAALLRRPGLAPAKRAEKEEIASWFRVWLETPELFPDWIALRRRALTPPVDQAR
jgi:hypothetical protein